jgi:protease-4
LGALIETFHDELVTAIRMGRELSQDSAERAIQDGPFTPTQAKAAGLVDHLVSVDEARRHLEHRPDGSEPDSDPGTSVAGETPVEVEDQDEAAETNAITNDDEPGELVSVADYHRARRRALGARGLGTSGRVALVYAVGAIVSGGSGEDAMFGRVMGSDTLTEALRTVRKDRSVDAVVLRIDSPGGTSVASDLIWREAMLTGQEKPVVVSMGNVAASGGYWLATASDVVVAEPTTVTGSIGVFAGKFNVAGLYEKLGLSTDGVSTADNADFFSGSRSFSESERERMQSWVLEDYEAFLHRVAEARGISRDEAHAVAQGRVWSGRDALEVGLVDELGGLDRAIAVAKEKAGLDEDDLVELVVYPKKRNFYEVLLSELSPASTRRSVGPPSELAWLQWIESSETLRALRGARTLTLMPFDLRIK